MKTRYRQMIFLLFLTSFLWGCLSIQEVQLDHADFYKATLSEVNRIPPARPIASHPTLLAGAAKVALPLSPGLPMAGYGKRAGTAKGTHDPLFARALALKQGEERVLLISVDLLAITDEMRSAVFRKIQGNRPFPSRGLMISSTHTHSGPGGLSSGFLEQFSAGPFNRDYFEELTDTIADAALRAAGALKPARISYGTAAAPDLIRNRMNPSGPVDPEVHFIEILGEVGQPIATLVNFSAHATVLKPDNLYFSGDYPGFLEAALEEHGGIALFTAGSVADQTPHPIMGLDGYPQAESMGRALAQKIRDSRRTLPEEISPLFAQTLSIQLPPTQVKVRPDRRLASFLSRPFFNSQTMIQAIRIGPIILVGIPADVSVVLGEKIKAHARERGMEAIIIGFANDYIGYLLPHDLYLTDAYEARMSFHGPQMGEYFLEMAERLIDRVQGPNSLQPIPPATAALGGSR